MFYVFFFLSLHRLIYLFLFTYDDVCFHKSYFHTALDQIPYEVCARWVHFSNEPHR